MTYNTRPGIHLSDAISPVIDEDGNLYSLAWIDMVKLNSQGELQWRIGTDHYLRNMPLFTEDETILLTGFYPDSYGDTQGRLFSFQENGEEEWYFDSPDEYDGGFPGSAAISPNGTIYLCAKNDGLIAISSSGSLKWQYTTENITSSTPALTPDGTIIITDAGNIVYAIDANGSLKWQKQLNLSVVNDPALDALGNIYLASEKGLISLSTFGDIRWEFSIEDGVSFRPAVGCNKQVVCGGHNGSIYSISNAGVQNWQYNTSEPLACTPTLDSRGHIYLGNNQEQFYALTENGELKWSYPLSIGYGQPSIGEDGYLYVGTRDGQIIAFRD